MLDIDKELEEFNRLLGEVDDEVDSPIDDESGHDADPATNGPQTTASFDTAELDDYEVGSADYDIESDEYDVKSGHYDIESDGYDVESDGYDVESTAYESADYAAEPVDYHSESASYEMESNDYEAGSPEFDLESPEFDLESPEFDLESPEFDLESPEYDLGSAEYAGDSVEYDVDDSGDVESYEDIAAQFARDILEEEDEEAAEIDYSVGYTPVPDAVGEVRYSLWGADSLSDEQRVDASFDGNLDTDNRQPLRVSFQELAASEERSWKITEHIGPGGDGDTEETDSRDAADEEWSESREPSDAMDRPNYVPPVRRPGRNRFPNLGRLDSDRTRRALDPHAVDSLLRGAKGALASSLYPNPRGSSSVTPITAKLSDDAGWDGGPRHAIAAALTSKRFSSTSKRITSTISSAISSAIPQGARSRISSAVDTRILPLLTSKAGLFEERLGLITGVVTGVVILVAAVLFGPRMFSSSDDVLAYGSSGPAGETRLASDASLSDAESALSISTFPPGARVYLNEELIGVTPFRDVRVEAGLYEVKIEKSDFAAIDTVFTLDRPQDHFFDLTRQDVLLAENTFEPSDHQLLQVTQEPTRETAPAGNDPTSQRRRDSEDLYASAVPESSSRRPTSESRTDSRQRTRADRTPSPGSLIVTSEPMGASIFVNGQVVGETPATLPELASGRVGLMLEKEGYVPYETEIMVAPSIRTPFHAVLAQVKASLFINANPGGDLYVDGQLVRRGIAPGHMEMVAVGTRTVKVVNADYGEYTEQVVVTPDNKASVSVDMVTHGYQRSIANGDRLFSESRYQEAIENYNRALAIQPGDTNLEKKIALAAKAMAESGMSTDDGHVAPPDGIYTVTETPPQLIGGLEGLHSRVEYPEEAYTQGIQGRVYVQLVVDEDGQPQDITIARGLKGGCNEAAIKAVKKSRFSPATVGGVPVKARHTLFINFTL